MSANAARWTKSTRSVSFLDSSVKGLRGFYAMLFLRGIGMGILMPILPLYFRSVGVSVAEWGALAAVFALGMLASEPGWGLLSDRVGRNFVITLSLMSAAVIVPLYVSLIYLPFFFLLQFARGVFNVATAPASRAIVSETVSSSDMGTAMGLWQTTMQLGRMVGAVVGTYIAQTSSYAFSIYASSLTSLMAGVAWLLWFKGSPSAWKSRASHSAVTLGDVVKALSSKQLTVLFCLTGILFVGVAGVETFLPLFAVENLGASTLSAGVVLATFHGVSVVASPLMGRVSDKVGRGVGVVAGFMLFILAFLGYSVSLDVYHLVLPTAIAAIGFSLIAPSLLALLTESVLPSMYGVSMGVYGAFEDIGLITGPLLYGVVWTLGGPRTAFFASAIALAVGVVLSLVVRGFAHRPFLPTNR